MANLCVITLTVLVCTLWATKVQSMPQNIGVITTTPEPSTWDKIKKGAERGWQVVYDETHCAFHKVSCFCVFSFKFMLIMICVHQVKGLVKQHDHDEGSDPCENKPYQQSTSTTPKSIGNTS